MRELEHLAALVACDTRNPPRALDPTSRIFAELRARLDAIGGFDVRVIDHGAGCVSLYAVRGRPRLLFNVHLDTVPASPSWSRDPFTLEVTSDRAIGLGAADIKGAAACLLTAAERSPADLALLLTSDEEAGGSRCVAEFVRGLAATPHVPDEPPYEAVIVGEPTSCRALTAHRGYASAVAGFRGTAGHSSDIRALADSAVHEAIRWGSAALAHAQAEEARVVGGLRGVRLNLGVIEGGSKDNVIADRCEVRFTVRSRPGESAESILAALQQLAPNPARAAWRTTHLGAPLPPPGAAAALTDAVEALRLRLGVEAAPPADFWTEAPLFMGAVTPDLALPAIVFGPGDIAQAHTADEWVALDQLARATAAYLRLLDGLPQ